MVEAAERPVDQAASLGAVTCVTGIASHVALGIDVGALEIGIGVRRDGRAGAVRHPRLELAAGLAQADAGDVAAHAIRSRAKSADAPLVRAARRANVLGNDRPARSALTSGVAGTVTTAAAGVLGLRSDARRREHHHRDRDAVPQIHDPLSMALSRDPANAS